MRRRYKIILFAFWAIVWTPGAAAQEGLSYARSAGLGLKPLGGEAVRAAPVFGGEAAQLWVSTPASGYALFGGRREAPRLGLHATESYAGVVYPLRRGWGSSFEAGYAQESPLAPRRYALTGRLHTSLSEGRTLSIGLKYRGHDPEPGPRNGMPAEILAADGYTLAPSRLAGIAQAPGYQVHMSFQYSASGSVGLALGREVETYTPLQDAFASGPRQLLFTGQHWVTPSWALSYDVLSHDLASPLRLQGLRLGVRYRF
jgi:hypothetical protein